MKFRTSLLTIAALFAPSLACAQSAIETYPHELTPFMEPLSSSTRAITGPLRVGHHTMIFGDTIVSTELVQRAWRDFGGNGEKVTATIYRLLEDPGVLQNGNSLCGASIRPTYAVVWIDHGGIFGSTYKMAIWSGNNAPFDASSDGLCGYYTYIIG